MTDEQSRLAFDLLVRIQDDLVEIKGALASQNAALERMIVAAHQFGMNNA
ncbi:hypothetical protein [Sphingomonas sp. EC-HK361]|nr:hypothetical protein [Sphingomonas sp. EC-HK361]